MDFTVVRVLRTPHSERFVLHQGDRDMAALDLHYLDRGKVDGTLILFDDAPVKEDEIPQILAQLDETLLPDVSIQEKNLSFTVVVGRVLGAYLPEKQTPLHGNGH